MADAAGRSEHLCPPLPARPGPDAGTSAARRDGSDHSGRGRRRLADRKDARRTGHSASASERLDPCRRRLGPGRRLDGRTRAAVTGVRRSPAGFPSGERDAARPAPASPRAAARPDATGVRGASSDHPRAEGAGCRGLAILRPTGPGTGRAGARPGAADAPAVASASPHDAVLDGPPLRHRTAAFRRHPGRRGARPPPGADRHDATARGPSMADALAGDRALVSRRSVGGRLR